MIRLIRFLLLIMLCSAMAQTQPGAGLRILLHTPEGETQSIDQSLRIIAAFSEPMTALSIAGAGSCPISLTPAVEGRCRWLGTTTLAFMPKDTLPFSTRFTVTIPKETRAISGAALRQPSVWSFETPRPAVLRTVPASGSRSIEPDHTILIVFNQPIDLAQIGRWISLEETKSGRTTYTEYSVRRPSDEELQMQGAHPLDARRTLSLQEKKRRDRERSCALVIVPSAAFEKGSHVRVVLKAGLQGAEGPLGMKKDSFLEFSVYGDLHFSGITSENNFHPSSAIRFDFTNPVKLDELARHVTLTPSAAVTPGYGEDYAAAQQYLSFALAPETSYRGVITSGLTDIYGNRLGADAAFSFRTSSYPPSLRMTTGPGVLEASEAHRIPVTLLNTDSVEVVMGRVRPERVAAFLSSTTFYGNDEWTHASLRDAAGGKSIRRLWKIDAARNQSVLRPLSIDAALGAEGKGIVLVQLKPFGGDQKRVLRTVVQVTEIGLTAKFSPESILIYATRLKDTEPVTGADVEVRTDSNRVVWRGTTGSDGIARAPGWARLGIEPVREFYGQDEEYESLRAPRLWVIVKKKDDVALTSSQWNEGIEPYAFNIDVDWNPQPVRYEAMLFTDRGLYKAGETVEAKGIIRIQKEGVWQTPPPLALRVRITDPRGEEVMKKNVSANAFGSLPFRIPIARSAATGYYQMTLEVREPAQKASKAQKLQKKERWRQLAYGTFRVEAFRAAEFEVRAAFEREALTAGDTARGTVSARYLFGAPMKNAPVRWRFLLSPSSFIPKGFESYSFGREEWLFNVEPRSFNRLLESGEGVLDDAGSRTLSASLASSDVKGTSLLTLEGDAVSASRQTLSGRQSVIVHGGLFYIGVKPSTSFLSADSTLSIDLVAVTKDGQWTPKRELTVKIFRRMWHSVRKAVTGGRYEWQSEAADSLVDSLKVESAAHPLTHRFTPKHPGFYYISASSFDERGNAIETQSTFYVSGGGYVAWERGNDDKIELVADRAHYAPGDAAEILVKNPYERARALITIEREGILSHSTVMLEGSAPKLRIPIERAYLPNVFVSVILLEGRIESPSDSQEKDLGKPSFKIGYVKLSVSPKEKHLDVSVEASKKEYHPGDSCTVTVQVRTSDGRGAKSEVALSVADQGVLSLIGYRLPDPFDTFYRERGLAVTTSETRIHLVSQRSYGEKGEDAGGGGASLKMAAELDAEGVRKDFRASAYWNASLVTDDSGRVIIRFKLPDNITAFTAMAAAQTLAAEFGAGEASFAVAKPVLIQPSMPRLARLGDRFNAGIVVMNYTSIPRSVSVRASTSGITCSAKDTITIELAPGQAREVTYEFSADRIGTASVSVKARSGAEEDGLRWSFPVIAPKPKESTALFASSLEPVSREKILLPQSISPDEGTLDVTAASSALIGLSGAVRYLFTYPYGCLEQRASAVLPVILAKDMIDAFHLSLPGMTDAKETAQKTIDDIAAFQKFNGGFSYWKNDEQVSPFLSAYAALTLIEAREHSYRVKPRAIENALQYLSRVLSGDERDERYAPEATLSTRA
ncbi:MAG: Ig-like domain-containing protein, partial [Acidobacteriota bacterium]